MSSSPEEEEEEEPMRSRVSSFIKMVSSYNSNVLLAALLSLLLVLLFIFLLHFYARFFWSVSDHSLLRRRRRRRITRSLPVLSPSSFIHASALDMNTNTTTIDKGLDSSAISSIPLFLYEGEEGECGPECAICLGLWEVGDVGRKLRKCGHGFHVECIDMWLSSHSTCPLCRAPVVASTESEAMGNIDNGVDGEVRVEVYSEENRDRRISSSCPVIETEETPKPEEVRVVVVLSGEGDCSSSSSSSVVGSSLKRMLSRSRSESKKVFPSATNDSSEE